MKVLLVNGGPHQDGCTNRALKEVSKTLEENGIKTEIMWLGTKAISGCIACNACIKTGRCVIEDKVNEFLEKVEETDAFVFGSPVHFAAISGSLSSFMDRVFYGRGKLFANKVAAGVVSCRRGGATAAFDEINKYFLMSNMIVVGSSYWNMVHGSTKEQVEKDEEGLQTMRNLGNNIVWLLKSIEAGKEKGIKLPKREEPIKTNFIR